MRPGVIGGAGARAQRISQGMSGPGYREQLVALDRLATPAPWSWDDMLYGVGWGGDFRPLGFAPHRPADARLVVVYRGALPDLLAAVNAVERLALRASNGERVAAALGMRLVLGVLDGLGTTTEPYRAGLAALDRITTPPPWDPGHLTIGMGTDQEGVARPRPGDAPLIAAARAAVPRGLALLDLVETAIARHATRDGHIHAEAADAILAAIRAFDTHSASEGVGISTV